MDHVSVLYEDPWILVVDKPSGVPSQSTRDGKAIPIDRLMRRDRDYIALHHRLDQPASGALVLAKHRDANQGLAALFSRHQARRTYLAILSGRPRQDSMRLDAALDGKQAVTHLHVAGHQHALTAAEFRLETGRLHQIRRHAQLARLPIVGDRRYGGDVGRWLPRLALHAWRLQFPHPVTEQTIDVVAPLPDALHRPWRNAGGPAQLHGQPVLMSS
jgi:RluA family pseudouridine synthase